MVWLPQILNTQYRRNEELSSETSIKFSKLGVFLNLSLVLRPLPLTPGGARGRGTRTDWSYII